MFNERLVSWMNVTINTMLEISIRIELTGTSALRGVKSVDAWLRYCMTVVRTSKTSLSSHEGIFTYHVKRIRYRLIGLGGKLTLDMKHCFTTKSLISQGPSLHQQNFFSRFFVSASMRPFLTRKASS
jgi:hypothetical protein